MNKKTTFLYPVLSGFLGASLALYGPPLARDLYAYGGGAPVRSTSLVLEDAAGRRKITLDRTADGGSSLFFFDSQDRSRMEVGTYGDGLPFVVLEGEHHTPKALLRMAGPNQSGVLVFKDKHNRDRMILGLDMNDADEEPFLVTFDRKGQRKVVFGQDSGFAH